MRSAISRAVMSVLPPGAKGRCEWHIRTILRMPRPARPRRFGRVELTQRQTTVAVALLRLLQVVCIGEALDHPLIDVVARMEMRGIAVDRHGSVYVSELFAGLPPEGPGPDTDPSTIAAGLVDLLDLRESAPFGEFSTTATVAGFLCGSIPATPCV